MVMKRTGEVLAERLIMNAWNENRIEGKINLLTAGTGVGKTYSSMTRLIPSLIKEGSTKFILTTPLVDSAVSTQKEFLNRRKEIERKLEREMDTDLEIKVVTDVSSFIDSFSDESEIMVLVTNHDQLLNSPKTKESNRELLIRYQNYLQTNKLVVIVDEIHYGGSTEVSTTKGNTGNNQSNYTAAMVNFLAVLCKRSWVIGISATLINEMQGKYFNVLKDLLDHPEIYNICTPPDSAATHSELTRILSNYNETYWIDGDNVVETTVEHFESFRSVLAAQAADLENHFGELDFDPNPVCMLTCSYGTYKGNPTTPNGFNVPIHHSIPIVSGICKGLGQDPDAYIMAETTMDSARLYNIKGEHVDVDSSRIEKILNGTDLEYNDVRYLFVVEKFKMSMNVPRIVFYASARERKGTVLNEIDSSGNKVTITVTIRQLMGRAIRPWFGVKIGKDSVFGKDSYSPEDIHEYISENFSSNPRYSDLLKYMRMANSHSFCLPNVLQFQNALEEWKSGFSAPLEMSMFQPESGAEITTTVTNFSGEEIGEECPTCGRAGYINPSKLDFDFNEIANSQSIN